MISMAAVVMIRLRYSSLTKKSACAACDRYHWLFPTFEWLSAVIWLVPLFTPSVKLRVMEDNHATNLIVKKGYSPKLRHVPRTHKVNLSCLSEVFADGSARSEYVDTRDQAADIFTKALQPLLHAQRSACRFVVA